MALWCCHNYNDNTVAFRLLILSHNAWLCPVFDRCLSLGTCDNSQCLNNLFSVHCQYTVHIILTNSCIDIP